MKKVIAAFILFLGMSNVPTNLFALEANNNQGKKGVTEIFKIKGCEDGDLVAFTGPSTGLFNNFPRGIKPLDETKLATAQGLFTKIRNSSNEVVGVGSELEEIGSDAEGLYVKTDWTLKIPGRGALFATEVERVNKLLEAFDDMKKKGEQKRSFDPPLYIATTVPGTGSIIGGTGEFSGAGGSFKEINEFRYITLSPGSICADITLEVTFSNVKDKK